MEPSWIENPTKERNKGKDTKHIFPLCRQSVGEGKVLPSEGKEKNQDHRPENTNDTNLTVRRLSLKETDKRRHNKRK
jgi:hypothetical protein